MRRELLRNHGKLSEMFFDEGDMAAAIQSSRQATKLAQQLVALPGATVADRRNVATALVSLGWQLAHTKQLGDGVLFIRQSLAVFEALYAEFPADGTVRRNLALGYNRLGEALLYGTNNYQDALGAYRKGVEIANKLHQDEPHNTRISKVLAYAHIGVGVALTHLKQPRTAFASHLKAVDLLRPAFDAAPKNDTARFDVSNAAGEAGAALIAMGELKAAEAQLTQAVSTLSGVSNIADGTPDDSKVLLGLHYSRLGLIHALRAEVPGVAAAEQSKACEQSSRWFALAGPLLAPVKADIPSQWRARAKGTVEQLAKEAQICAKVLTADRK